jgi:hypothetical protein
MLTKKDLSQIENVVEKRTRKIIQEELTPIKDEIKTIKKDTREIRSDIKAIVSFFDREYIDLLKRVERIEEHLGLPPLQ